MVRTSVPGIYRRGSRYVVRYRLDGRNMSESAATLAEAKQIKRAREAARDSGELQTAESRITFEEYATQWVERHPTVRERTRDAYRSNLLRYAFPQLGKKRLSRLTRGDLVRFADWLADERAQGQRVADEKRAAIAARRGCDPRAVTVEVEPLYLADGTRRRILAAVQACLRAAADEEIIRHNPAAGLRFPSLDELRRPVADDDEPARALTAEQLADLLRVVPARHALLFRLLAATGLRISEALALRWRDVQLDGSTPEVKVRRAYVRGTFGAPKSRESRRAVPLSHEVVTGLREAQTSTEWPGDDDLVFPSANGQPLDYPNLRTRVLIPAAEEAGVPWVGFHTLRHTCASLLFARGRNVKQVQRWLGHADPGFTLRTYVHVLDGDLGGPLDLAGDVEPAECPPIVPAAWEQE